jgi:hypothetical protein
VLHEDLDGVCTEHDVVSVSLDAGSACVDDGSVCLDVVSVQVDVVELLVHGVPAYRDVVLVLARRRPRVRGRGDGVR